MRLNEIKVEKGFEDLFSFKTEDDEIRHLAATIMFKFISQLEKITNGNITKKQWSEIIGTTPSYITQLFSGNKLINLLTMAKIEKALDLEIEITISRLEKKTSIQMATDDYRSDEQFLDYAPIKIAGLIKIPSRLRMPLYKKKNNNYSPLNKGKDLITMPVK